jgi:hypothetical protein
MSGAVNVEGYEALEGRVLAVKIAFAALAAVTLVAFVFDWFTLSLADQLVAGEMVSDAKLDADDARQGVVGTVQFGVYVVCAVVFIRWLSRAYGNLDAVAPAQRRYSQGWAVGAWFVPVLNLWRPKQTVNDVWRAGGTSPSTLLAVWWAGFILSGWTGTLILRSVNDESPQGYRDSTIAYLISDGLDVPITILAIVAVVKTTQRLELARAEVWHAAECQSRIEVADPA